MKYFPIVINRLRVSVNIIIIYAYKNVCQDSIHRHQALSGQLSWKHGSVGGGK